MDEGDGKVGRARHDVLPLPPHVALGRRVDAGHDLDERRFPRAVLAEKRVDLAASDVEIHVIERERAGELLDDASKLQELLSRTPGVVRAAQGATPQIFRYSAL